MRTANDDKSTAVQSATAPRRLGKMILTLLNRLIEALSAWRAGDRPAANHQETLRRRFVGDLPNPDRQEIIRVLKALAGRPRNRGRFPGAVVGLRRYGADKLGERRDDLSAGDAKASPQEFIE